MGVNGSCKFRLEYVRLNKGGFGLNNFKLRQGAFSTRFVGRSVGNEFYISVMPLVVYICC